jgi:uncharacterized protein YjbJ (UPF0337 family)
MDADILKGKWKQLKGEIKKQWGDLTDDDLTFAEGDRDKLTGKLQERYGWSKDEARRKLDEWTSTKRDIDLR